MQNHGHERYFQSKSWPSLDPNDKKTKPIEEHARYYLVNEREQTREYRKMTI
jgi:hypothetical protein